MKARHSIFAIGLVLWPIAALALALGWPWLLWRALRHSEKQNAPELTLRASTGAIEADANVRKFHGDPLFQSCPKVVPKQSDSRFPKTLKSLSH